MRTSQRAAATFLAVFLMALVSSVSGQYVKRRNVESRLGEASRPKAKGKGSDPVRIRRLIGVGPQTRVKTPEYRTTAQKSTTRPKEWAQVALTYDTSPEWIDAMTVQYHVMSMIREDGQNLYSLYRKTIDYVDIEEGRSHLSTVFLRPAAVKRYGETVAVHVEVLVDGEKVATEDDIDPGMKSQLPEDWWENRRVLENANLTVRDAYLLNRNETPFALINVDDYEVIP